MVTIAGSFKPTVCKPPSTSRVTSIVPSAGVELEREGPLRPAEQRCQHLAGLVGIVVDRLLAEDHQIGLLLLDHLLQKLGHRQRLHRRVGLDQDAAIGSHGERRADGLACLLRTDRNRDDLGRLALLP